MCVGVSAGRGVTDNSISNTNLNFNKLNRTNRNYLSGTLCKSSGAFNIVLDCNKDSSVLLDCQVIVFETEFFDIQREVVLGCIKQCNAHIWVIGTFKEKMIGIIKPQLQAGLLHKSASSIIKPQLQAGLLHK